MQVNSLFFCLGCVGMFERLKRFFNSLRRKDKVCDVVEFTLRDAMENDASVMKDSGVNSLGSKADCNSSSTMSSILLKQDPEAYERGEWIPVPYKHVSPKEFQARQIAEQNRKRQESTLGYGLKSRNFKPRPGHERRTWNLQKKAED